IAVAVGPGTTEILLGTRQLRAAVDVVRHAVTVAVGEDRAAAVLGGTGDVGAEIVDVGHAVAVCILRAPRQRRRLPVGLPVAGAARLSLAFRAAAPAYRSASLASARASA